MYCPNCGKITSLEQRFCRSCGLSLERISQLLAELIPTLEAEDASRIKRRLRDLERLGKIAGIVVCMLSGLFLLAFFFGAGIEGINNDNPGEGFLLLGMGAGVIVVALFAAYYIILRRKASEQQRQQPELIQAEETAKLFPETYLETIPSVTEQTTELLRADREADKRS
jgi:hypothetical protein